MYDNQMNFQHNINLMGKYLAPFPVFSSITDLLHDDNDSLTERECRGVEEKHTFFNVY